MDIVILTALGVGGSTVFGAVIGLIFRRTNKEFGDLVMSLSAGIMLAAAFLGLIIPSLEYGGDGGVFITSIGMFIGAMLVNCFDYLLKIYNGSLGVGSKNQNISSNSLRRALTFASAIAIHNLPEGIAAGVGFGTGNMTDGIFIATAIALQNIPEGMAVFVALLSVGISAGRTFVLAALTGIVEIGGTFIGYFAVSLCAPLLPFILALAGGSMLYIICDEMIPEARSDGSHKSTYMFLFGFALMLILDTFL